MLIKIKEKTVDDGRFGFFPGAGLLLSPFAKILSGVLVLSLLGSGVFSVIKIFEVKNLKIELLQSKQEERRLENELDKCKLKLDSQNIRIAEIRADADKDIIAVKEVNDQLNKVTEIQDREIERLKNAPAPESCEESTQWLIDNLQIFERE
jgi:hypothetical protein